MSKGKKGQCIGDLSKTHVFQKVGEKLSGYSGPITPLECTDVQ